MAQAKGGSRRKSLYATKTEHPGSHFWGVVRRLGILTTFGKKSGDLRDLGCFGETAFFGTNLKIPGNGRRLV